MKLTFIADTFGLHAKLKLLKGKILIHAGNVTTHGTEEEALDFLKWFAMQPF